MNLRAWPALSALTLGLALTLAAVPAPADEIPGVGETAGPLHALSPVEMRQWLRGRELYDKDFHLADGVGTPEMNADSCRACHQDPVLGGAGGLELNVSRFGNDNGGLGPFTNLPGGQGLSKLRPPPDGTRENYDALAADVFEQRQTPLSIGLGLMESISEAEILSNEDPDDTNPPDGIYGVARLVDVGGGQLEVGRFGWKAQVPRITDFIRDAMAGECGITTPDDGRGFALAADADAVADPELSQSEIDDMEFFLALAAPPQRKGSTDPQVAVGESLFAQVGCQNCHRVLQGPGGPVPLYSDLLLHHVLPADFRGMVEPGAGAGYFRTPPLWGISDTAPYFHDGRAETILDAILMHEGEAEAVRSAFEALAPADQDALLLFLEDL
jgi:CxxC motif-containing protein (DUF1111 family)